MYGMRLSIPVSRVQIEEMVVIPSFLDRLYSLPLFQIVPNLQISGASAVLSAERLTPVKPGALYQIDGALDISPTLLPSDLLSLNLSQMVLVREARIE